MWKTDHVWNLNKLNLSSSYPSAPLPVATYFCENPFYSHFLENLSFVRQFKSNFCVANVNHKELHVPFNPSSVTAWPYVNIKSPELILLVQSASLSKVQKWKQFILVIANFSHGCTRRGGDCVLVLVMGFINSTGCKRTRNY